MSRRFAGLVLLVTLIAPGGGRAAVSPAFTLGPSPGAIEREIVVRLAPPRRGVSPARQRETFAARATAAGLTWVASLDPVAAAAPEEAFATGSARVVLLRAADGEAREALARLAADPDVAWVEPNLPRALCEFPADRSLPDDPLMRDTRQWGLWNAGAAGVYRGTEGADIGARAAWALSCGDNALLLAVADTGVDPHHPDLDRRMPDGSPRLAFGRNVSTARAAWADSNGHGTAVAGVMAALTNDGAHFDSLGVAGVCGGDGGLLAGCRLVPIRITPDGYGYSSSFEIASAILYAVSLGARAMNLSFAGGGDSRVERLALMEAITHGCVVVAASGNGGVSASPAVQYPAAYAAEGLCLAVGASDARDRRAAFSSYGPSLDLVAPGLDVWSTALTYPNAFGARYPGCLSASGTSFAAPHVTGTIGLVLARMPQLTDTDLQQLLRLTAHDVGAPGRDDPTGWGRLDAAAAVRAAGPGFGVWHDERAAMVRSTGVFAPLDTWADAFGNFAQGSAWRGRIAERFEARVTVAIPDSFADSARVWSRVGGTTTLRGDFRLAHFAPWAEAIERRGREVTLRGFLYRVPLEGASGLEAPPDSADSWLPLPPDQARIGFTVYGPVDPARLAAAASPPRPGALRVAPNPARGAVRIMGPPGAPIEVLDLAGRRVHAARLDEARGEHAWAGRDASGRRAPAGLYFVRVRGGGGAERFIIL